MTKASSMTVAKTVTQMINLIGELRLLVAIDSMPLELQKARQLLRQLDAKLEAKAPAENTEKMTSQASQKFDRLAYVQDWDDETKVRLLKGFLEERGLLAEFQAHAQTIADSINLSGLRGGDSSLDQKVAKAMGLPFKHEASTDEGQSEDFPIKEIEFDFQTVAELSRQFLIALRESVSDDDYQKIVALNKAEADPGICHSHDFTDANMVMARAFTAVTKTETDLRSTSQANLWSRAWAQAVRDMTAEPLQEAAVTPVPESVAQGQGAYLARLPARSDDFPSP
jgi:hypothetical protein